MAKLRTKGFQLGMFIFVSFLLFIAGILILGRKRSMFQQTIAVSTVFHDVKGLKVGNNVRFTGIDVGAVVDIEILSDTAVLVEMSIEENVIPFIKKDSKATIGSDGLMGSKLVQILPGSADSKIIEKGDQIPSTAPVEIDDIMSEFGKSSRQIATIAGNLAEITEKVNRGDGVFGKLFSDEEFTRQIDESGKNFAELSASLNELLAKINRGEGLMGKMVNDPAMAQRIDSTTINLNEVAANLERLTASLNSGDNVFSMLTDTSMSGGLNDAAANLDVTLTNLAQLSEKLNDKNNALNKFIADPEFADSVEVMLNNLNNGILEVTAASEALQKSGFVRAFSKDPKEKK